MKKGPLVAETCLCGCGRVPTVAKRNDPRRGWVKGERLDWVRGHNVNPVSPDAVQLLVAKGDSRVARLEKLAESLTKLLEDAVASGSMTPATASRTVGLIHEMADKLRKSDTEESARVKDVWDVLRSVYPSRRMMRASIWGGR